MMLVMFGMLRFSRKEIKKGWRSCSEIEFCSSGAGGYQRFVGILKGLVRGKFQGGFAMRKGWMATITAW